MRPVRLSLLALLLLIPGIHAQAPAAPPAVAAPAPAPTFEEKLAAKAAQNRYAVTFKDGAFSGPGWDRLLEEGRKSQFFLVGEEHGIAEVPAVVRELFRALHPAGYRNLAVEISPPMARVVDGMVRPPDGLQRLTKFFADNPPGVPFFTLAEEAELLAAVRATAPGKDEVIWGLDYDMTGDRYLLESLRRRAPEGPARQAAEALYQKSEAAWKTVSTTGNPAAFFSFANPPEVVDDLRKAWPNPDPESALILDVMRETLAINQLFAQGHGWESNELRAQLNRRDFLRYWNAAKAQGTPPRVMLKFGASHMYRGRNMSEVFDLGTLTSELAFIDGSQSFHLLVVGGAGTQHSIFNPVKLVYEPAPVEMTAEKGLQPLLGQTLPEGFTLIDLRALRPLLSAARTRTADPELMRIVHGFDAVLILNGSHPSRMLPGGR
jgi:hypothetical protein